MNGIQHHYPEGHYELRSCQGSKAVYKNAGTNATEALNAQKREAHLLIARDAAVSSGSLLVEEPGRVSLSRQAVTFVEAAEDRGSMVAAKSYQLAVDAFLADTGKTYADQITAADLSAHHAALKRAECGARTVYNRNQLVKAFLRHCGVPADVLQVKAPKYDETLPEIYDGHDLKRLFELITDPYHALIFNLLLKTGLREHTRGHVPGMADISFQSRTLTIRSKPKFGFRIRDKKERSVPLTTDLEPLLMAYKALHPERGWYCNGKDNPNTYGF